MRSCPNPWPTGGHGSGPSRLRMGPPDCPTSPVGSQASDGPHSGGWIPLISTSLPQ